MKRLSLAITVLSLLGLLPMGPLFADDAGLELFEKKVRPILAEHCLKCHQSDKKQEAGLALDRREAILKGGDSGPAVVAGDAKQSRLIAAVRHEGDVQMPPMGKLSAEQIEVLEQWINLGAPFPAAANSTEGIEERIKRAKDHWSFRPITPPTLPKVTNAAWVRNDIDRFILAKLESAGLTPTHEADRATYIRRVTFDLTGLPPTPKEVEDFERDASPTTFETLIDRLLASPHYGERWGRHWLDLARYADSSGVHNDLDRPWAWKYRDYVIRSFNDDTSYPRFVAEQLAGDEIAGASNATIIATGFGRNGPSNDDNMGKTAAAVAQYRADQLDDVISTTASVFLGMTIGCARCHDHKTDPITARDYYSLLAVFNGTEKHGLVPGTEDVKGAKVKLDPAIQIQGLVETKSTVPTTHMMRRGIATNLGEEVGPAPPAVLCATPLVFPTPDPDAKSSLRRKTLAEWITAADNPLSWRVLANRIWQHHFGQGIVATPSNFGFAGARPTHPELLDYLATELIHHGGRWKPIHQQIVLSATYRQSSQPTPATLERDPNNELVGRMILRRLEAEAIRDSILTVAGTLNRHIGGPGIKPRLPADLIPASQRNKWPVIKEETSDHWRRSVYIYSKRQLLMPIMELFDAPTTTDSTAVRSSSIVPTQALVLMNDEFVETQAGHFADRALRETDCQQPAVIERMLRLAYGRSPEPTQVQQAAAFVQRRSAQSDLRAGLTDLAHVLFNSSEFLSVP